MFEKIHLVVMGVIQYLKSLQENCLIFEKISDRYNRGRSNFKSNQQNCLIFGEILLRDNMGS